MNFISAINLVKTILKNRVLSSLLLLVVLGAAIISGSNLVLLASGILTFARPLLYVAMLGHDADDKKPSNMEIDRRRLPFDRRASNPPKAFGAF